MIVAEPAESAEAPKPATTDKTTFLKKDRVRTPTVLQMEAVECGAASLAMVLAYYGLWVPLEELRVTCGVSRDGAKASNVVKGARVYGMEAKGIKADVDEVLKLEFPFIVFWNFNHFVVVEGAVGKSVYINDPASGPRKITRKEFDESYTGVALTMKPGPEFKKGGERRSVVKALNGYLKGSRTVLSYVIMVSMVLVVPGLLMPAFLKAFIDDVLIKDHNTWLLPILVGLLLTAVFSGFLTFIQQRYLLRVQIKLAISLAGKFFWHVLRVPVVFYTQRYVGDVAARVKSCHTVASLLSGSLSTNIVNCMMIVFYAAVMLLYSIPLTLIAAFLALVNVGALQMVKRKLKDLNSHLLNQQAKLTGASMAGLQAIETLKATGTENDFFGIWSGYQTNTINTNQNLGSYSAFLNSVPGLINSLTTALILGAGGFLIIDGQLTIGGLVAFQALLGHFTGPIQQLVGFGAQIQQIEGDLNRLDDVFRYKRDPVLHLDETAEDEPEKADNDNDEDAAPVYDGPDQLSGAIHIRDLCFGYSSLEAPLIEGFDLTLTPGKRVAFVGGSGSGKSTLAKLILGLYQPWSGTIHYDGYSIEQIPRNIFTNSVASVDQEIFLFEGTISDNLTMWDPSIPKEFMVRGAKDACIHDVITERPGGYESEVSEGNTNFSGGQSQRLEIARALVRNPKVIVLDEATASLDPLTEKMIDDNLRRRGCSCIIIAHRLSTIRDCDEIIVMDRGKLVERGTHDELMALKGRYSQLVAMQ